MDDWVEEKGRRERERLRYVGRSSREKKKKAERTKRGSKK